MSILLLIRYRNVKCYDKRHCIYIWKSSVVTCTCTPKHLEGRDKIRNRSPSLSVYQVQGQSGLQEILSQILLLGKLISPLFLSKLGTGDGPGLPNAYEFVGSSLRTALKERKKKVKKWSPPSKLLGGWRESSTLPEVLAYTQHSHGHSHLSVTGDSDTLIQT